MSGLVGHTLYAILAAKSAEARSLRIAGTLRRNLPNYLCGAYLGCDIQVMPGASLIKSIRPGIKMHLLDGTYTPRNRPIQDLFAFHEIGLKELHLDWRALFTGMAAAPVEAIQPHYMRIAPREGELSRVFAEGWRPERADLLQTVLKENRRWLKHHAQDVLENMALTRGKGGPVVSPTVKAATGGLDYAPMMAMAERSNLRGTLQTIADSAADLFEKVIALVPSLK